MYGYPEQFIPAPELIGYSPAPHGRRPDHVGADGRNREVTA